MVKKKYDWWFWILIVVFALSFILLIKILFFGGVK